MMANRGFGIGKKVKEIKKKENAPPAPSVKGGQKAKGTTASGEWIFVFAFYRNISRLGLCHPISILHLATQ